MQRCLYAEAQNQVRGSNRFTTLICPSLRALRGILDVQRVGKATDPSPEANGEYNNTVNYQHDHRLRQEVFFYSSEASF